MRVLLTNQQKLLMEVLEILGGARLDQLAALLRPVFCLNKPEIALRLTESAIRQMRCGNITIDWEDDLVFLPGRKPAPHLLEAIDVMLELSGGNPQGYWCGKPPIILRFSVQEQKARLFAVTISGADLTGADFNRAERIILLSNGKEQMRPLPVSNRQFIAVRQRDGLHRFFAVDGQGQ